MPIRQPLGISTPASSAASRIGRGAVGLDVGAGWSKVTVPPSPATTRVGPEPLGEQRRGRAAAWCSSRASSRPAGPQASVVRSVRSGTSVGEVGDVEHAVLVVVPRDQPDRARPRRARAGRRRRSSRARSARRARRRCRSRAAGQSHDAGVGDREQVAQHPDHRGDAGAGGDEQQLAAVGRAARTRRRPARGGPACRAARARTRWLLTMPSGTALTVIEMRPSARGPWVSE